MRQRELFVAVSDDGAGAATERLQPGLRNATRGRLHPAAPADPELLLADLGKQA